MYISSLLKTASLCTLLLLSVSPIAIPAPTNDLVLTVSPSGYTHYRNLTGAIITSFNGETVVSVNPTSHNSPTTAKRSLKKRFNDCAPSTIEDHTTNASPTVVDCQGIADYAYAHNQFWGFNSITSSWYDLIECGECTFGVKTADSIPTYVGNEDFGDLVTSSINKFKWYGLVGAQGKMGCERDWPIGKSNVEWAIY